MENRPYLSVVGNISGVYRKTMAKAPVMPNFPTLMRAVLRGSRDTPPSRNQQQYIALCQLWNITNYSDSNYCFSVIN